MTIHRPVLVGLLLFLPARANSEVRAPDPRAVAIADQVIEALGGKERWERLRGLRWSFGFEVGDTIRTLRRHSWDKHSGWHRVEGTNRDGQPFCYVENLDDGSGRAWVAGLPVEGDSLQKLLETARRMWVNDTYWLLMPYKLRDPGVILSYTGEVTDSNGVFDKLALSFDGVGLTPGDRYWVFVNRANHRIERWEYVLEQREPPPDGSTWEGWQEHGGLWFATSHRRPNGNLFTRDIETVSAFGPTEFSEP